MKFNPKDYTRVFGGPDMPFITSFMFAYHYRQIDFLETWKNNLWTAFLKKEILEKTLNDGLEFYSDSKKIVEYKQNYKEHYKNSLPFFDKVSKKNELKRSEVEQFFKYAGDVLSLYVKCEFFYTDKAFESAQNNKGLKNNLSDFDKIKNPGKEQIIKVFFDSNSYIFKILNILSRQFAVDFDSLINYTPEEIVLLFDDKFVDESIISKRINFYILLAKKNGVDILTDNKYSQIIDELIPPTERKDIFKGTVANKGMTHGKVKLFNHGYDFSKVSKLISEMEKGDILVTETTSPELMSACKKAGAIVTNEGGLLSHAAIVSRELDIPCIVGAHGVTSSLKDGDVVEVDANNGIIKKVNN